MPQGRRPRRCCAPRRSTRPRPPVIVVTAFGVHGDRRRGDEARRLRLHHQAVQARRGRADRSSNGARAQARCATRTATSETQLAAPAPASRTSSARARRCASVFDIIRKIAPTAPSTVHDHGESGTGKELVAAAHPLSGARAATGRSSRSTAAAHPRDACSRVRALRAREGRVHRRRRQHRSGLLRGGRRRHALPRRDRRDAAAAPGQAAARLQEREIRPRRRTRKRRQGRRADHRRDQPRPRARRSQDGTLPRGPLLPPQRRAHPAAAAARAPRGHPAARRATSSGNLSKPSSARTCAA